MTTSPILSMSSVPSEFKAPLCSHGNQYGSCEECEREHNEAQERRIGEEKEAERLRHDEEMKRRKERPWSWLISYGVPVKYREESFDTFQGGAAVKKACSFFPEKNIVLIGKTGCGKTHLAVARMREMVINNEVPKGGITRTRDSWEMPTSAVFITTPMLLMEIRDSFKDESGQTERGLVEYYSSIPILILDDLGADRATDWAIETLYLIIDGRDSNLKPTFITTNLTIPEIEKHYGARIASRLAGMNIVTIDMPDYRKKR